MSRYRQVAQTHSRRMVPIAAEDWPEGSNADGVTAVWHSREYLAVLYRDDCGERLSINRTAWDTHRNSWRDSIPWEDLQRVKSQCGFGNHWAVEVYPPDADVVDDAAMRHLWLLPEQPDYGWTAANAAKPARV